MKLDKEGECIQCKRYDTNDTTTNPICPSTASDSLGNLYVAFNTNGVVGAYNEGEVDIVLMKLDPSGNVIWIKQDMDLNTPTNEMTPQLTIDINDYLYLSYITDGTVTDTNVGGFDIVVAKLDTNGTLIWNKQNPLFNTPMNDISNIISVDVNGNVYIAYQTQGNVPGKLNYGGYDIVVFKLDTNGVLQWTKQEKLLNTTKDDITPSIASDINGNCYIAYSTNGTLPNNKSSGKYDIVIFKLDTNGNIVWRTQHPTINSIDSELCPSIQVDQRECIYLVYTRVQEDGSSCVIIVKFCTKKCCDEDLDNCGNIEYPICSGDIKQVCYPESHQYSDVNKNSDIKKTVMYNKLMEIIQYYYNQISTIKIIETHVISIIYLLGKFSADPKCNANITKDISQYMTNLRNCCMGHYKGKKIINDIRNTFYGTVESVTAKPLGYTNGLAGVSLNVLSGNIVVTQTSQDSIDPTKTKTITGTFTMNAGDDIAYIANRIRPKFCHKLDVADGLEVGIHINYCGLLVMTIKSKECGDISGYFEVYGNTDDEHVCLTKQIKEQFAKYIDYIDYDISIQTIRIIFKKGYTMIVRQQHPMPINQFTITTYINNIIINPGINTTTNDMYAYGYLLMYNSEPDFTITMPPSFLNVSPINPKIITESSIYFKQNVTLYIGDIFCPRLIATDKIILKVGNYYEESIDIKTFSSWNGFISTMLKQLENELDGYQYNVFRVNNVLHNMIGYKNYLHTIQKLLVITYNMLAKTINMFTKHTHLK